MWIIAFITYGVCDFIRKAGVDTTCLISVTPTGFGVQAIGGMFQLVSFGEFADVPLCGFFGDVE